MTGTLELLCGDGTDRTTDALHALMYPHADGTWWTKTSSGTEVPLQGVATTRSVTGAGLLAGGGDLSANRTITFGTMPASTILANLTGGAAVPTAATTAAIKTLLAIAAGDVSGLGALATLGSVDTTQIANNAVDLTKLSDMSAATFLGQILGGSGDPVKMTAAQAKTALAITSGDVSGLGALATLSTVGSAQITNGAVANADLAPMSAATFKGQILGGSGDPVDMSATQAKTALAITSTDVSGLGALATLGAVGAAQITDGSVGNAELGTMGASTVKGSVIGGAPVDLTRAQLLAILQQGNVPQSLVANVAITGTTILPVGAFLIPANTVAIGDTFHLEFGGTLTQTAVASTGNYFIKSATTAGGITAGTILGQVSFTSAAAKTSTPAMQSAVLTIRSIGAGGTAIAAMVLSGQGYYLTPTLNATTGIVVAAAFNTTVDQYIGMCVTNSAATLTGVITNGYMSRVVGGT